MEQEKNKKEMYPGMDPEEEAPVFLLSAAVEYKRASFLLPGIPADNITLLVGDGGIGKGFFACHLAAAVTNGSYCILDDVKEHIPERQPGRVLFINAEDSFSRITKRRLDSARADHTKIITADEDRPVPMISDITEQIQRWKPRLAVIDPLQSFVPSGAAMERRNVMRKIMQPLQRTAAACECAILIVMHTNKRVGAYGRNRVADSADIWDIARSAFILGEVGDEDKTIYISNEKSSYGDRLPTQLCRIENNGRGVGIVSVGTTSKSDRDFVQERDRHPGGRPAVYRDEAQSFILDMLARAGGSMDGKQLALIAEQNDIKKRTFERARAALNEDGRIEIIHTGHGKDFAAIYKLNGLAPIK